MDNSYDKRVSNLEAVVTPLIDKLQHQPTTQDTDTTSLLTSISFQKAVDERLKAPIQEKTRQITALEKEIIMLK